MTSIEGPRRLDIKTPKALELRSALTEAVRVQPADALMLSGGVDSSALAALDPKIPAFTAVLAGRGGDLQNAQRVTERLGVPWYGIELSEQEAVDALREVVTLTKSYDPALLNDIPLYAAMRHAANLGMRRIRTGDFADTPFKGYTYMRDIDLPSYLEGLLPHLSLASSRLGRQMGLSMNYPYLYPRVIDVAKSMTNDDVLAEVQTETVGDFAEGMRRGRKKKTPTQTWGKIALRQAMLGLVPTESVFRTKTDLEFGSGMYRLEDYLAKLVTPKKRRELTQEEITFWNKMHAGLYTLYKELGLKPQRPTDPNTQYSCTWCTGSVDIGRHHCITCGAYPADQPKKAQGKKL